MKYRTAKLIGFLAIAIIALTLTAPAQVSVDGREMSRQALSDSFAGIAKRVGPAVVNIESRASAPEISVRGDGERDSLDEMIRRQQRPATNFGSGFIVEKSGLIITNFHVVEGAAKVFVQLESGEEFVAKVIGLDDETDLALIRIDAGRDLPVLRFADSDTVRVGDWVLAFGSPFGLAKSVTAGIVSQVGRETPNAAVRPFQKFIQTDAAINRGNSGGPLIDMNGDVIGVNSQIATSNGDSNGIAFALPANDAVRAYRQLAANGRVRRGYLGVNMDTVRAEIAKVYGLSEARGAIITNISDKKSAAAIAGLQPGDIVLEIDGTPVIDSQDLVTRIASYEPEKTVSLLIVREEPSGLQRKTVAVKLGERPSTVREGPNPDRRVLGTIPQPAANPLGISVVPVTATTIAIFKLENIAGVAVKSIDPKSFMADLRSSAGDDLLREGDIITRINRVSVPDQKTFDAEASKLKKGDAVVLQVIALTPQRTTVLKFVQFTVR